MSFFAPSTRQISAVGLLLCLIVLATIGYSSYITSWSKLVYDRPAGSEIFDIAELHLLTDLPASQDVTQNVLAGGTPENTVLIVVTNFSRFQPSKSDFVTFGDQVRTYFDGKSARRLMPKMEGKDYLFYSDVDLNKLSAISDPTLFFHRIPSANWKVFWNNQLLRHGRGPDSYVAIPLPTKEGEKGRLTFLVTAHFPDRLTGPYFTYGLTIRSAKEAAWAQQNLPAQHQYPRILAAVFLAVFALVGFAMAGSTPQYTDVWAYGAFCAALAMMVWKHTPFFWGSFEWSPGGVSLAYDASWLSFDLLFMLTAVTLNLTFFRIRGLYFRVIIGGAIASAVYVFWRNFPGWNPDIKSYQAYANVGRAVVVLLLFSQGVGSLLGFTDLWQALKAAKKSEILPRVARIKRRIAYAVVFSFGVGVMQYFYLSGLVKQSTTPGPDLFLLAGIVPAGLILLLFSWTIGAANRERLKLAPSLEVIDELILEQGDRAIYATDMKNRIIKDEFGHPVKREYLGVLAWFDLKGFTMTDALRKIDDRHRAEVDQFFADVEMDLSDLYHNLYPRMRFKWAGDELSWAYFARNREDADKMVVKAFNVWRDNAARLTARWKSDLISRLGAQIDPAVVEAMEYVDVHVAFTRLDEFKIKPGLFESKADYDSPSYTRISRAFKHSTHARVAVFEEAGLAIVAQAAAEGVKSAAKATSPTSGSDVVWRPALTPEREAELRTQFAADPARIKQINEELMLAGTGFLEFGVDAAEDGPAKSRGREVA